MQTKYNKSIMKRYVGNVVLNSMYEYIKYTVLTSNILTGGSFILNVYHL